MDQLTHLRQQIDDFMHHHPQSPIPADQRTNFDGLDYYDENDQLAFVGPLEKFPADDPIITMETSTGDTRHYRRWGRIHFEVDGEDASLVIYCDPYGDDLFLPFRDGTSGSETYGAGRYMDNHRPGLQRVGQDEVAVDFNYAYNPYCAYNSAYSCPLPPRENWLKVPIRAGEKGFDQ